MTDFKGPLRVHFLPSRHHNPYDVEMLDKAKSFEITRTSQVTIGSIDDGIKDVCEGGVL
jgi:hypothetical protein